MSLSFVDFEQHTNLEISLFQLDAKQAATKERIR
jgi:hypothetical protein